jgi:ssDNA-binding Zn-finger/Zn-ribbon topoisomerase 1
MDLDAAAKRALYAVSHIKNLRKPRGFRGDTDCPNCGKRMQYYISDRNGHIRAFCETKGCTQFIQ